MHTQTGSSRSRSRSMTPTSGGATVGVRDQALQPTGRPNPQWLPMGLQPPYVPVTFLNPRTASSLVVESFFWWRGTSVSATANCLCHNRTVPRHKHACMHRQHQQGPTSGGAAPPAPPPQTEPPPSPPGPRGSAPQTPCPRHRHHHQHRHACRRPCAAPPGRQPRPRRQQKKKNSLPPVNWRWVEEGDRYVGRLQPPGQPLGVGLPSGLQCLVPYPYGGSQVARRRRRTARVVVADVRGLEQR